MGKLFTAVPFILAPFLALAGDVQVPDIVSDLINDASSAIIPETIALSSVFVAIVQSLKVVFLHLHVDISGKKSGALAVAVAVLYALFNLEVWQDGLISSQDVILVFQSAVSAVAGIYGYKLLWRKPKEVGHGND